MEQTIKDFSHAEDGFKWIKQMIRNYDLHESESEINFSNISFNDWKQHLLETLKQEDQEGQKVQEGNVLQFCVAFCEAFPKHAHLCYVTNKHGEMNFHVYIRDSFYNIRKAIKHKNFLKYCHLPQRKFLKKIDNDSWVVVLPTFNESKKLENLSLLEFLFSTNTMVLKNSD